MSLRNRHPKGQPSSSTSLPIHPSTSTTVTTTINDSHASVHSKQSSLATKNETADVMAGNIPPKEINLVTLNCWGLKVLSKLRNERLTSIGKRLAAANPPPDIVALQECWCQEDYESIRRETRFILPYGKFYYSGAFGGGLAILSRWPIEESSMHAYPLNGRPTAFWRGDWYVGKGVAWAMIRYGPNRRDVVEVFNTHTHAPYESGPKDSYICHRLAQSWEISKLLRAACDRGHLVLAMGDFNMIPLSFPHRLITANAPVRDVWRVLHPDSAIGPYDNPSERARHRPVPTAIYNITENGATSDSVYNSWRWTSEQQRQWAKGQHVEITPDTLDRRGKRLDYIFASTGLTPDSAPGSPGWIVKDVHVGMVELHETLYCSLSDHFSVEATLAFHTPDIAVPPIPAKLLAAGEEAATESDSLNTFDPFLNIQSLDSATRQLYGSAVPDADASILETGTYDDILGLIKFYKQRQEKQRFWQAFVFWVSLLVFFGACIAIWWAPYPWVAFLLLLIFSLFLVCGVVNGLTCLLFGGSEKRALAEFEWEILNAKAGGDIAVHAGGTLPFAVDEREKMV